MMKLTLFLLAAVACQLVVAGTTTDASTVPGGADDMALDVTAGDGEDANNTCGGNCPGGCHSCPCGTSPSHQDIAAWCAKSKKWNQKSCECIIKHESGGNAHAANMNHNGSYDVGLWQINTVNWKSCSGGHAPCSSSTNLACAEKVFAWGGNTWKLWSTCHTCGNCHTK